MGKGNFYMRICRNSRGGFLNRGGGGADNWNSPFWGTGLKYNFKCPDKCAVVLLSLKLLFSIRRGGDPLAWAHMQHRQIIGPFPPRRPCSHL